MPKWYPSIEGTTSVDNTETPVIDIRGDNVTKLEFLIDDTVVPGTAAITVKFYESIDGTTWELSHFCLLSTNVYDPTVDPAVNSHAQTQNTIETYRVLFTSPYMRVTAQRGAVETKNLGYIVRLWK